MDGSAIGSWLSGPRASAAEAGLDLGYRGERLGLPEHGSGAIASFGRRVVAVAVDWLACLAIARGLLHGGGWTTLAVFAVEDLLLTALLGYTLGKRLTGLRVRAVDGRRPGLLAVALRTGLLCLAVPALIWDRDGRGLHDKAARTVVVRA
jgi:uncharacterized RDD family membrane protein YckC